MKSATILAGLEALAKVAQLLPGQELPRHIHEQARLAHWAMVDEYRSELAAKRMRDRSTKTEEQAPVLHGALWIDIPAAEVIL